MTAALSPDPWRRAEFAEALEAGVCLIAGCPYDDIDVRGPIFLNLPGRLDALVGAACREHWEAIIGIVGRSVPPGGGDAYRPAGPPLPGPLVP